MLGLPDSYERSGRAYGHPRIALFLDRQAVEAKFGAKRRSIGIESAGIDILLTYSRPTPHCNEMTRLIHRYIRIGLVPRGFGVDLELGAQPSASGIESLAKYAPRIAVMPVATPDNDVIAQGINRHGRIGLIVGRSRIHAKFSPANQRPDQSQRKISQSTLRKHRYILIINFYSHSYYKDSLYNIQAKAAGRRRDELHLDFVLPGTWEGENG
jgi:hypothetical protein